MQGSIHRGLQLLLAGILLFPHHWLLAGEPAPGTGAPALAPSGSVPGAVGPRLLLAGRARVRQGTTEFSIAPLRKAQAVDAFYAYGAVYASSAATGLEISGMSLLFLYEDTTIAPSRLSLVVIHDIHDDADGGQTTFVISGLPAEIALAVMDDPDDGYDPVPPMGLPLTATWNWSPCCTDGLAIRGLEAAPFCISIQPNFVSGITAWQAVDGPDPAAPARIPIPRLAETVILCGDCQKLSCPGTITAECTGNGSAVVSVVASGTSECGGAAVANDRTPGGADASGSYPLGNTSVSFTLGDSAGFTTACTTAVQVEDTIPPLVGNCPPPLAIDCTGAGGVLVSDPRIQAWLAGFDATDACGPVTLSNDAPAVFPAACPGTTPVVFRAEDARGNFSTCLSGVTVDVRCPPCDIGGPPPEPSAETSLHPLRVVSKEGMAVVAEKIGCATAYDIYADRIGSWYAPSLATGTACNLATWQDNGDGTVTLDYKIPVNSWIAVTSASCSGDSSAGRSSAGVERKSVGAWAVCPPGP